MVRQILPILAVLIFALVGKSTAEDCGCAPDPVAEKCTRGSQQGATALASYLKEKYPGIKTEEYNCRIIGPDDKRLSLHAVGRAVDVTPGSQKVFDEMVTIAGACKTGIQEIIYNGKIWTSADKVKDYTGKNVHEDHVHIGLNNCGARQEKFVV